MTHRLKTFRHAQHRLLLCAVALAACGSDGPSVGNPGGAGAASGTGGRVGASFNQCGVAAPLLADTGRCTTVTAPLIADFDDFTGTSAANYTYYVNGKPPATNAVQGAVQHIGDGSDTNGGTGVITTEMVMGEGGAGYAFRVADSNAMNWGGLMMFYFPGGTAGCLNAPAYRGIEFSIKGSSASGRFGVSLGMLDTTPMADGGLCNSATASDCKSASVELTMPTDAATWAQVRVAWDAFTPGVGSGLLCIPVTGQNIARIVIQPFMAYPPPTYTLQPGPYAMAIDNVRFFQ